MQIWHSPIGCNQHPGSLVQTLYVPNWPQLAQVHLKLFLKSEIWLLTVHVSHSTELSSQHSPSYLLDALYFIAGRTLFRNFITGWRKNHPIINLNCLNTLSEAPPKSIIRAGNLSVALCDWIEGELKRYLTHDWRIVIQKLFQMSECNLSQHSLWSPNIRVSLSTVRPLSEKTASF